MDLHLHTPASDDYQEPDVTYLDIIRQAHALRLDLIAITDHNTVSGYRSMLQEISELELLERRERLRPEEAQRLEEYRHLLAEIVVLPGFEFTATFGFHVLAVFSPDTSVRTIEHVLLDLNVPADQLDSGSMAIGATADVLTAYRSIEEAGGITIAAHANSTNGVAMRGFRFGGQTKIAYTQDSHLHALEVTDLDSRSRRKTAHFFNGSKPEYPRRMHCIQGSDAHRLVQDPKNPKSLGVGERITEVLLEQASFKALKNLFQSTDFARTRPYRGTRKEVDFVQTAREEGPNIVQDFHERVAQRGGHLYAIICDVCALANTNGGTIYVGVGRNARDNPVGVTNPSRAIETLQVEISRRITPALICSIDVLATRGKRIVRISVPRGEDPPYAIDDNKIYVRDEADTSSAVRDEIVQLVHGRLHLEHEDGQKNSVSDGPENGKTAEIREREPTLTVDPPRTGVEIVDSQERDGTLYHTMRDLRNGNQVKNVTRTSSRKLWHYAILEREADPELKHEQLTWHGDLGLIKKQKRSGVTRYDLCHRGSEGLRVYYGVSDDGIHGQWKGVVGSDDE